MRPHRKAASCESFLIVQKESFSIDSHVYLAMCRNRTITSSKIHFSSTSSCSKWDAKIGKIQVKFVTFVS